MTEKPPLPIVDIDNAKFVSTILARPVFDPSRRAPSLHIAHTTNPSLELRLAGILITSKEREAIIVVDNKNTFAVKIGDHVSNIIVRLITADKVIIDGPTGSQVLTMSYKDRFETSEERSMPNGKNVSVSTDLGYAKNPGTSLVSISDKIRMTESGTIISDKITDTQNFERAISHFGLTGLPFR